MPWTIFLFCCLAAVNSASGKCSRTGATESFILSTNAMTSSSNIYKRIMGPSLIDCTRTCLNDVTCESFTFLRSQNETQCLLTAGGTDTSKRYPEHRLYPASGTYRMEKVCLKGACDRLFVAESLRGMELEGHNDLVVGNNTRLSCLESCINSRDLNCRSVEFDSKTSECRLSRHDRFSRNTHFKKSTSAHIEYFDVTCPYQQPTSDGGPAEILLLGNVEHPYSLIEYEDVTAEECGELCLRNILFPCRSFLSGRVDSRLYCGLTHQNREGLVQNPESLHASRSLNYYEIARSVEACDSSDLHFEMMSGVVLNLAPYTVTTDLTPSECLQRCKDDRRCRSVGVDYKKGACQYNSESIGLSLDPKLQQNGNFNYYEKICLPGTQCTREWAFERSKNKELVGIEHEKVLVEANSKDECQLACLHHTEFVCLSAEFNYQLSECRLSPYNRFSSTEKGVFLTNSRFVVDYFENNCISVSVDCRQDLMLAQVRTNALFKGKLYAKGKPLTCSTDVSNSLEFSLPIPLKGENCGTVSEEEGKFSNVLVIQSNDHVVTALDKAIGIHCSYDVGNKTEETEINITDPGSSDRSRGSPALPDLSLHIVDMEGQERDTVSLGELLRVQVRMSDEDTYGIFVRNLVAKDGIGGNNLTLIDNTGCPVEVKMMREVRTIEPQSKSLEGYLEAFTFTGSSLLELEAEVETCLENCKPVLCQIPTGRRDDDTETVSSYGRKKRDSGSDVLSTVTLSKSVSVQAQDFESVEAFSTENYASPVTAPSMPDMKGSGLFHRFSPPVVGSESHFCFDPTLFALIGGGFFLAEICGFSACLIAACRWKRNRKTESIMSKKRHLSIHYENSVDAASDVSCK
ncbi:uncharacterized protein LOC118181224 isoform X2 [Stegodyphus dumicola]|uniref:uncharacterized protein LOC118181224 isoform X2 n=1 Tax=Stegodyphus dumicola TaxID=202533 RepID=UPI0015B084FD|nr:uncharacterized protein LOC118181224 isoform X2 [Stegodyphus dumicola]